MFNNEVFGANIEKNREKLNISRSELAASTNLNHSYLCDVEHNRKVPTSKMAVAIANYFGLSINDLLDDTYDFACKEAYINKILDALDVFDGPELDYLHQVALGFKENKGAN